MDLNNNLFNNDKWYNTMLIKNNTHQKDCIDKILDL